MPWSNKPGGPWGGGGNDSEDGERGPWGGNGKGQPQPNIDDLLRQGQDKLRDVFGGGGGGAGGGGRSGRSPVGGGVSKGGLLFALLAVVSVWVYASVFKVEREEAGVKMTFGKYTDTVGPGLNIALWPVQTYAILPVTLENVIDIGFRSSGNGQRSAVREEGLMLTGDENIVDIEFQVVWNISKPDDFLFNLAAPDETVKAVAESAMREVIGRADLKPILNRDRAIIAEEVKERIQKTLDAYSSGVNIVRVNFDRADPPQEVIDSFRDVQAAAQDRDTLKKRAEAYANQKLAQARGEAAQLEQEAEGYRAQVVNEAQGHAARFKSVYAEYVQAKDVTRKRLYLETLETVMGGMNKVIIDQSAEGGQGVVPYLPLNELRKSSAAPALDLAKGAAQ